MSVRSRVYLETTIISYMVARPSRDLRAAARQQATIEWWSQHGREFDLYVSQFVLDEASDGDSDASARRLQVVAGMDLLDVNEAVLDLAQRLVVRGAVPEAAGADALHIAVAAVHGMDYLLTWNCRHIANAAVRTRIEAACADAGFDAPTICTPEELLDD